MPEVQQQTPFPPLPPAEPVQEGSRWRWHRPTSEEVARWFATQPLDEGMEHTKYVGGVTLIPQNEKVKYTKPDGSGQIERHEQVFTPYVQIGTRVAYFRHLAESRGLIASSKAAVVPRSENPASVYFNGNMPEGLWWHVVHAEGGASRFLCATWTVRLYERTSYARLMNGEDPLPVLEGTGTKQVGGFPDINQIAKAQTGALGRALGVAGILVVGTGIASAEDMLEYSGQAAPAPTLPPSEIAAGEQPPPAVAGDDLASLRARAMALQARMQEQKPEVWAEFAAWWQERSQSEGWGTLGEVPFEALKGIVSRMERSLHPATVVGPTTTTVQT